MKWKRFLACCGWLVAMHTAMAQQVAIKNNLLYDAVLTPNLSVEMQLAKKWTLDVQGTANFFLYQTDPMKADYDEKKWSHVMIQPGARYWFCESFYGWFVGAHLLGGAMNVGGVNIPFILQNKNREMVNHRYEGWFVGGGVSVGYQRPLAKHWSVEAEVGLGYASVHYDKFRCRSCGKKIGSGRADYLGPTKAAVSLVYHF